jgi:hypothetical protein
LLTLQKSNLLENFIRAIGQRNYNTNLGLVSRRPRFGKRLQSEKIKRYPCHSQPLQIPDTRIPRTYRNHKHHRCQLFTGIDATFQVICERCQAKLSRRHQRRKNAKAKDIVEQSKDDNRHATTRT